MKINTKKGNRRWMKFPIVAQLMNIFQFLSPQWYVYMSCFHIVEILKFNCDPLDFWNYLVPFLTQTTNVFN